MSNLNIEFEVYCWCGEGLCKQSEVTQSRYGISVTVSPCEKCLEQAKKDGYIEGYDKGCEDVRKEDK